MQATSVSGKIRLRRVLAWLGFQLGGGPFFQKEILKQGAAFLLTNPSRDFATVVELRHLQNVEEPARRTPFRIAAAKDHPPQTRVNQRPGAHRAGFLRHVEIAIGEPPVVDDALRLSNREHLRVGRGVFQRLHLIRRPRDDATFAHDHRTDGHFVRLVSPHRLTQRFAHKINVARQIDDGFVGLLAHAGKIDGIFQIATRLGVGFNAR